MLNGLFFIYSKFIENVCFTHTVQLDRDRNQKCKIENFKKSVFGVSENRVRFLLLSWSIFRR